MGLRVAMPMWIIVILLALPAAATAQNGFPSYRAAEDQYCPPNCPPQNPPPQGGGQGQPPGNPGNNNGNNPNNGGNNNPGNGGGREASRDDDDDDEDGGPGARSGAGPDTAAGGPAGGVKGLPLADAKGGRLPFTGLDVSLLVLIAVMLLGGGALMKVVERRGARGPRSSS